MKSKTLSVLFVLAVAAAPAMAADYVIDTRGAHASINFSIPHLGYSILVGRFDEFSGGFSFDPENPAATKVDVTIKTASINSNHEARDRHLRADDFLAAEKYPEARFVSTGFDTKDGGDSGVLKGDLTLRGVTKPVEITVKKVGEGKDPWGGYRAGFEGSTSLLLSDFGINYDLGPAAKSVDLVLHVEGVRQ